MEDEREVTIWSGDGLTVRASLDEGELLIIGEDLQAARTFGDDVTEYAYGITVDAADVPRVLAGLDVAADVGVLDALVLRGEDLVRIGAAGWLESIGVQPQFWSRIS